MDDTIEIGKVYPGETVTREMLRSMLSGQNLITSDLYGNPVTETMDYYNRLLNYEEDNMEKLYEVHLYMKNEDGTLQEGGVTNRLLATNSRDARNQMLIKHSDMLSIAEHSGYVFFIQPYERFEE